MENVGRNDRCPCNSGKKYKHCCGKLAARGALPGAGIPAPREQEKRDAAPGPGVTEAGRVWELLDADMHLQTLKKDYAPVGLLEMVSRRPDRVLDVGCFCGGSGRWLKAKFPGCEVIGIELLEAAAAEAATAYDRVITGAIEQVDFDAQGLAPGSIDAIIAADVLEHLYNPWKVLQRLKPLLAQDGALYVSLPNIRNLNILVALAQGDWQYSGGGILDITHLRFFTRKQAVQMLAETGWRVEALLINRDPSLTPMLQGRDLSQLRSINAGMLKFDNLAPEDAAELIALQFFIRAVPVPSGRA